VKPFLKIARGVAVAAIICVVAVAFLSWRSKSQLNAIVSELSPGTPFSTAVARLGRPTHTITTTNEMRVFDRDGTHSSNSDTTLYLFAHLGPPYRWVFVYTDGASQTIRYAEWQPM
jgi:hypothetical protein